MHVSDLRTNDAKGSNHFPQAIKLNFSLGHGPFYLVLGTKTQAQKAKKETKANER